MAERRPGRHEDEIPFWFGPDDRKLFGWLQVPPDGEARGGVVLCPPMGIEAICLYFSYRVLAKRLAQLGLAVLRFDYDGTGDSCGEETDPGRLDAWLASVTEATDRLAESGVPRIGLVGVRIGGLFAVHEAARRDGVDALVLWDTCLSGRAFLREQQFLRAVSGTADDDSDEAVEAPGIRFEPATVKELASLDLKHMNGRLADRTLVLTPPDLSRPRGLERRLDGTAVDWQEATGQEALLDSIRQTPPTETIERVAGWLASTIAGDPVVLSGLPDSPQHVEVGSTGSGAAVVERTATIGSLDLFGIVTESETRNDRPAIVLVNEGNTPHIGQARIWVDLARRLGASGFTVLRFDLSGNGDSDPRPGKPAHAARLPESVDDVFEAMRWVSPGDPTDVVLVGFCSGAYLAVEQALVHPPQGICLINPLLTFLPPEESATASRPARQTTRPWLVRVLDPPLRALATRKGGTEPARWMKALHAATWPVALSERFPRIPEWVWWTVRRTLLEHTCSATLERLVGLDVDTMIVASPTDLHHFTLGAERTFERLRRSPHFRLTTVEELDHSSWVMRQRRLLVDAVDDHLGSAFGRLRTSSARPDPGRSGMDQPD